MAEGEVAGGDLPGRSAPLHTVWERLSVLRAGTEALVPRIVDLAALERESAATGLRAVAHDLRTVADDLGDLVLATADFRDPRVPSVRVLFDDAPLPYVVTDIHGVILVANRAAGLLLARPPAELPGVPIAGYSGPPPGALRRVVTAAASSAVPRSAYLSLRSPRRSPRQVRATVQRLATGPSGPVLLWQFHPSTTAEPVPLPRPAGPERAAAPSRSDDPPPERDALIGAVLELASTLIAELDLPEALARVAGVAVRGVPGAEGASVTLLEPPSSGASDERVERADRAQFDEHDGPGMTAVSEGRTVVVDDVATDPRWVVGGPRVAVESGYRAVLAVPLTDGREVLGALTLYAATPGRFGPGSVAGAELLAVPAEAGVTNVRAYRASLHVADELRHGLVSRAVIDQAKGILMVQHGLTADQAFAVLTRFSQQENRKLRTVAADLVESSVRESRARLGAPSDG
ncbi:MAG TPA: ANTAR domain-containing protein [Mycobacteriales bacterium]|nr:ANTAR domain-containing protein [Mycobacteriales bacterium]